MKDVLNVKAFLPRN